MYLCISIFYRGAFWLSAMHLIFLCIRCQSSAAEFCVCLASRYTDGMHCVNSGVGVDGGSTGPGGPSLQNGGSPNPKKEG